MTAAQVFLFVLMALASYRLWRLVGYDDVTESFREKLPERLYDMVTCPWCLGSWVSFAVVAVTAYAVDVRWPWLQALGVSVLVGWLHGTLETHDEVEVLLRDDDDLM